MTIQTSNNKSIVLGDNVTTQFDFDFVGVAAAFIEVILTDSSGNETVLTQGSGSTQYQIVLNAASPGAIWGIGGVVTYNPSGTPIPAGSTLTIFRTLPLTQAISLQNQNSLTALGNGAETGLDTLEMQLQQVFENIARAIVAPITDPTPPAPLPPVAQRANQGAVFDASGNLTAGALPSSGVISSAMQPVVSAATLALGRTAFGLGTLATENIGAGLQDDGAGNVRVLPPLSEVASNQAIHAAAHTTNYMATGTLTFTLDRANTLFDGFYFDVYALTGPITFTPDSHDTILGQSSGASYTIPVGSSARMSTNAASSGTWFVEVSGISPQINQRIFTSTGTYTPSAGLLFAIVEAQGAGGGGGGVSGSNSNAICAGGGGAGLYVRGVFTAAQIGISQAITIGAAGTGGINFANGTAGGQTSFGGSLVAPGGGGGGKANNSTPGSPGGGSTAGSGALQVPGGNGDGGVLASATTFLGAGKGGDAYFGAGGAQSVGTAGTVVTGANAAGFGSGGAGASATSTTSQGTGGAAAPGIIIVTEFIAALR